MDIGYTLSVKRQVGFVVVPNPHSVINSNMSIPHRRY
jgi:hypothetical protein